jgi:hypothetical protein
MTAGVLVDDAIAWTLAEAAPGRAPIQVARAGEWRAYLWDAGSGPRPWRAQLRRNENDHRQVRCYATESAAKLRMAKFLRVVSS